ncbi:MAG TPA: hypothetical protein PLQ65_01085 [Flavihumibacter sp.]|nr:hypothetical protein [Flavihumibacter sp.]
MNRPSKKNLLYIILGAFLLALVLSVGLFVRLQSTFALRKLVSVLSDGKYQVEAKKIRVDPLHMVLRATGINIHPVNPDSANSDFYLQADTLSLKLNHIFRLIFQRNLSVDHFRMVNPSLVLKVDDRDSTRRVNREIIPLHIQVARMQDVFFKVLESMRVNNLSLVNGTVTYYPDFNGHGEKYFLNHLYLDINDLNLVKRISEWDHDNRVGIRFELRQPEIAYPDSTIAIDLSELLWDSKAHTFQLTGLGFHKRLGEANDSSGFRLEGIEIDSLNWNSLLTKGRVELGSLSASKGYFSSDNFSLKKNKDSVKSKPGGNIFDVIGPILVKRLSIHEIEFVGNTHTRRGKETLQIKGDELLVKQLLVDKNLPQRVQLDELQLKVKAFLESDSSRTFQSGFNELNIVGNDLILKGYFLHSLKPTKYGKNKIDIRSVALKGIAIEDLVAGKLHAKELVLTSPTAYIILPGKRKVRSGFRWSKFQKKLSEKMDIGKLRIEDASMYVHREGEKNPLISTEHFNAIINSHTAINSERLEDIFEGKNNFSLPQLAIRLPNMWIDCRDVRYEHKSFFAGNAKGRSIDGNMRFNVRQLQAYDINTTALLNRQDSTLLRHLEIRSGELYVKLPGKNKKPDTAAKKKADIVRNINAGQFSINIEGEGFSLRTTTDSLRLSHLAQGNDRWRWDSLRLSGGKLNLGINHIHASTGKYLISNYEETFIQQVAFALNSAGVNASIAAASMQLQLKLYNSKDILPSLHQVVIRQPVVKALLRNKSAPDTDDTRKRKTIDLPTIQLIDPQLALSRETDTGNRQLASVNGGNIKIHQVHVKPDGVETNGLDMDVRDLFSEQNKFKLQLPALTLSTGPIQLKPQTPLITQLEKLQLTGGSLDLDDGVKNISLHNISGTLEKSFRLNTSKDSLKRMLSSLPHLQLAAGRLYYQKADRTMVTSGLTVDAGRKRISFDSLQWTSSLTRDSFFRAAMVQKDFIQLQTGAGEISNYEMIPLVVDTAWKLGQLAVKDMRLLVERDKRYPNDTVRYRPLLAGALVNIPLMVNADRIVLDNGYIRYNEINEKNGQEGSIWFSKLNANIRYARNYDIGPTDSLRIMAHAQLMDEGDLRLNFAESYADSLKGFYMLARLGKMPFNALAPLLTPMFGVHIERGMLDSMTLRVKANDYLAYGKMDMKYHALNMSLYKQNQKRKFLSWAANLFLRDKNSKTGLVFRERMRNKSIFNYWGKIAASGLMTTMGIKGNKKVEKKYRREMKDLSLPASMLED